MAVKDDILKVMKKKGKPMGPGEIEKEVGADKKEFDQAFKELKAEGAVVSPVRCKWEPAKK
ncbi:MAG: transcriptional regulator [Methanomassiliicoccaceae archaeon]|nr:transcriptional regulator [Methanomassiliicoccaceae archaeon]MCL2318394.1 transcriptional regulator [Methanomassiliicoccaceae archaeon]